MEGAETDRSNRDGCKLTGRGGKRFDWRRLLGKRVYREFSRLFRFRVSIVLFAAWVLVICNWERIEAGQSRALGRKGRREFLDEFRGRKGRTGFRDRTWRPRASKRRTGRRQGSAGTIREKSGCFYGKETNRAWRYKHNLTTATYQYLRAFVPKYSKISHTFERRSIGGRAQERDEMTLECDLVSYSNTIKSAGVFLLPGFAQKDTTEETRLTRPRVEAGLSA